MLEEAIGLMKTAVGLGGGLWLLWGVIILAGGLKDKNGPQIQSGIWQTVGGGMILAAVILFDSLVTTF
jgi:hypothetical protein